MVADQKALVDGFALGLSVPSGALYHNTCEIAFPLPNHDGNSPAYDLLNGDRWSNTSILSPSCIFTPTTADSVARGIQILIQNSCHFAVKSGGHMPVVGANNINSGVTVDLLRLNETSLATDRSYVSLGAGAKWGEAYRNHEDDGVLFPGGVCGTTGIGGLSTGGGMSLFQPKVGWVVDNILTYEVVLASGEIVCANETHHSDLFRALKGGSSNFGIVTRVELAAFDYDRMWGGTITAPAIWPNVGNSLQAIHDFTSLNNEDVDAGLQMAFAYLSNGLKLIDVALASTSDTAKPEILKPFSNLHLQLKNTLRHRTMTNLVEEIDQVQPKGWREALATVTVKNDLDTLKAIHAATDVLYKTVNHVPRMDFVFMYVPQPRVIQNFAETRGGNVLGLENIEHDQISIFFSPRWKDDTYDDVMYKAAEEWVNLANGIAEDMGTQDPFLYLGFAGGFQKPLCGYGQDNVEFMRRVAAKYDPSGVFQTLVPGGFKLSEEC
ncbi:FAD binding domain protein [Thozetella sp. PMI_491]|nr:FAD binding domain protein [Thozetella sp. PMI_491]